MIALLQNCHPEWSLARLFATNGVEGPAVAFVFSFSRYNLIRPDQLPDFIEPGGRG
jgi:hypothetical protein